ncbi:MAG: hypothetical protein GC147_00285 [Porphyrobacter sp.]|nr:hypothetical protein [Porphyrobacter sp.]
MFMLAAGLAVSACSSASRQDVLALAESEPVPAGEQKEGLTITRFVGPGLVCGFTFGIELQPKERFSRFDKMMDFVTYRLEAPERAAIIYEGNAPQPADVVIKTGEDFPTMVAIHLDAGGYDKSLARRILTKDELPQACVSAKSE